MLGSLPLMVKLEACQQDLQYESNRDSRKDVTHLFLKVIVHYMSRQKRMSFSECSNVETKDVIHFKLCHQKDKRSNYNFQ